MYRYTPPKTFVAAFHFTIVLLPAGPTLLTQPPVWYKPELVKTEKELEDEELKELVTRKLRDTLDRLDPGVYVSLESVEE